MTSSFDAGHVLSCDLHLSPAFGIGAVFHDLDGVEEAAETDLVALGIRVRKPLSVWRAVGLFPWLASSQSSKRIVPVRALSPGTRETAGTVS